jgi:DNA-binding MarR family transcriptional regulator
MSVASSETELAAALERLLPRLWSTCLEVPAAAGLPPGQARTLMHLAAAGRQTMGQLAGELGVRLPSATRVVDRLVDRALVQRGTCPDDRRVVWVEPTPTGTRVAVLARASRRAALEGRLTGLDGRDREALARGLRLLEELVDDGR